MGWVINCPKYNSTKVSRSFLTNTKSKIKHPMCSLCSDVMDSVLNTNSCSVEQNRFLDMASTSILHGEDQYYEISLPLRDDGLRLPNNNKMVEKRAELLKRRFLENPGFYKDNQNFQNDMITNGYAEVVENCDNGEPGRLRYIPHHGVYHKNTPG